MWHRWQPPRCLLLPRRTTPLFKPLLAVLCPRRARCRDRLPVLRNPACSTWCRLAWQRATSGSTSPLAPIEGYSGIVILTSRCEPGFTQQEHFSALVWFDGSWHLLHLLPPQWSVTLGGESLRSIAFDFNKRGIKPAGGTKNGESKIDKWQGSILRRVLLSPRIAGLREHTGKSLARRSGRRLPHR
jgi:hypothetical protein